ncbi:hypothetical protein VDG1235_1914 [Verrucomicrobiia bacterium DG1235]|nr:hypothetical protein VDG1235_1914 [Verrucomicrobiae bacterium DG1235]
MLIAVALLVWNSRVTERDALELTFAELDLREDVLYLKGSDERFSGSLIEEYSSEFRKLEVSIVEGRAHGVSRGWYDNGQMEVEEFFANGLSDGVRTRWHPDGSKKSEAPIVKGVIDGVFKQWHENGVLAAEVHMDNGKNDGLARAWYPSGTLKSRVTFSDGVAGESAFFPDDLSIAQVDQAKTL